MMRLGVIAAADASHFVLGASFADRRHRVSAPNGTMRDEASQHNSMVVVPLPLALSFETISYD